MPPLQTGHIMLPREDPIPPVPSGSLELYFDGNFVTQAAGVISSAQNQAPSGATRDASQAVAGQRPLVGTPLNGQGTVVHDGTNDFLAGVFGGGGLAYTNATVITLSQRPGTSALRAVFDSAPGALTNTGFMMLQENANRLFRSGVASPGSDADYPFSSAAWTAHLGLRDGGSTFIELYEGTVVKDSPIGATNNTTLNNFRLGALFEDVFFWDGSWAEILLYSRKFTPADLAQYVAHANAKYGLSLV